jgi:hypothetical protein
VPYMNMNPKDIKAKRKHDHSREDVDGEIPST